MLMYVTPVIRVSLNNLLYTVCFYVIINPPHALQPIVELFVNICIISYKITRKLEGENMDYYFELTLMIILYLMTVILILSYYEIGKRQTRKSKTKNGYRYRCIKKNKPKRVLDDIVV